MRRNVWFNWFPLHLHIDSRALFLYRYVLNLLSLDLVPLDNFLVKMSVCKTFIIFNNRLINQSAVFRVAEVFIVQFWLRILRWFGSPGLAQLLFFVNWLLAISCWCQFLWSFSLVDFVVKFKRNMFCFALDSKAFFFWNPTLRIWHFIGIRYFVFCVHFILFLIIKL